MPERHEQASREKVAKVEIGRTEVSPRTASALACLFLATIFSVPVLQHVRELRRVAAGDRASVWPQCYDIFRSLPRALRTVARGEGGLVRRVFRANRVLLRDIHAYEDALEDAAWLRELVLPPAQAVMTRFLGVGNEQVYCGRSTGSPARRWLFYRADIDHVTGPGFLEPGRLAARAASGNEWTPPPQPNPVEAIADFARRLGRRGIHLVVMPTPVKPMVHPEKFSRRYEGFCRPPRNPSWEVFARELKKRNVLVFDVAAALVERKQRTGRPQYLATDTHWRPDAMEFCARKLAAFLAEHVELPERAVAYRRRTVEITHQGDLVRMLELPHSEALFPNERVRIHQVFTPSDDTWRADPSADVLLLGDSFTNVYSFDAMGWGFSAGLAEQLSYFLRRPVDRIVRNDAGAWATRAILSAQLARGRDRLAGKKVVVWQFAARELSGGDWKRLGLALGRPARGGFLELRPGERRVVTGTVAGISPVPRPHSQPYADYLLVLRLADLRDARGRALDKDALVTLWAMRGNVWTDAARLRLDQEVTLRLRPWEDVVREVPAIESINRAPPPAGLELEPMCWGERVEH